MRKTIIITNTELLQFFCSPAGYIFISVFVLIYAWFFAMPFFINNLATLQTFFTTTQLLFIVYIPIITMNLISREHQCGTIETLFTLPIKISSIIIGKFLAGFILVIFSLLPSLVHLTTIILLGENIEYGVLICGYIGLILTAAVYCAMGIFTGTLSSNQIVAFIFSFLLIVIFYLMDYILVYLPIYLTPYLQYISITWQNANLIKGVIDTRVLVYFISLIFIFLWGAAITFGNRRK